MHRALAVAGLLLALAGLLPGCLRCESRVVLRADGSGEAVAEARFDAAALRSLWARVRAGAAGMGLPVAAGLPQPPEGVDPLALPWLRADARGVEGLSAVAARLPGEPGARVEARFATLEAAARGGLFHGCEVALERRSERRLRFVLRPPWQASGPGGDDALGGLPQEALAAFAADLAALACTVTVTFPVAVASTNGTLAADGRTVTWALRGTPEAPAGALPEAWLDLPPGSDVELLTFRHRPDLVRLARRLAVAAPADTPQDLLDPEAAPAPR